MIGSLTSFWLVGDLVHLPSLCNVWIPATLCNCLEWFRQAPEDSSLLADPRDVILQGGEDDPVDCYLQYRCGGLQDLDIPMQHLVHIEFMD